MGTRLPPPPTRPNRLLTLLPAADADRLTGRMTMVPYAVRDVVYPPGKRVEAVYFPVAGVFSQMVVMADGASVEVGTVGSEGMLGTEVYLGSAHSPHQVFCQVTGAAWRLPVDVFRDETRAGGPLADLVRRFAQAQLVFAAQSTACGRLHSVDERCARWLLTTHDRVGADTFQLTQEFLALMLGVRRASVTVAAGGSGPTVGMRCRVGRSTRVPRRD